MRCYLCDGKGMRYDGFQNLYRTCEKCGGSGIAEPLTNEEWLRQASTEELADVIADFYLLGYTHGHNGTDIKSRQMWIEWLKEKHSAV